MMSFFNSGRRIINSFPLPIIGSFIDKVRAADFPAVVRITRDYPSIVNQCLITQPGGRFPLSEAITAKNREMVSFLVRSGASLHANKTVLHLNGTSIGSSWVNEEEESTLAHVHNCNDEIMKNLLLKQFELERKVIQFKNEIDDKTSDKDKLFNLEKLLKDPDLTEMLFLLINNAQYSTNGFDSVAKRFCYIIKGIPGDRKPFYRVIKEALAELSISDRDMLRYLLKSSKTNNVDIIDTLLFPVETEEHKQKPLFFCSYF